jgi:hypothetical protein
VLRLQGAKANGELYFEEGMVVHAVRNETKGEDAFLHLLKDTRRGGQFTFLGDVPLGAERSISKRTDHLLLGLASMLDEGSIEE